MSINAIYSSKNSFFFHILSKIIWRKIMKLQDAVILRIEQLCIEYGKTKYDLFKSSGVPQSTLTSIKKKRSGAVRINTLYAICEGFNISLEQFFASPLFNREELSD